LVSPAAVMPLAWNSPLLQATENIGNAAAAEHILDRKTQPATHRLAKLVMQLEQRDAVGAQSARGFGEAALDRAAQVGQVAVFDPHLGGDLRLRRERPDVAPDGLFRRAVAIERGGVDPVDAGLDRAGSAS